MNSLGYVFSPARSGILLGTVAALAALVLLLRPERAPVTLDPLAGLRSDARSSAAPRDISSANALQKDESGKSAEIDSVDQWMRASPRRARLMSPEAMAGYEPVLAALDLSPSQLRRLKQLIVERTESASDADQLGKDHRLSPEQTLLLRNEAEAASDLQLEAVIGTANFQVVREMLQLAPQLAEIADSVGRELARTGTPLDANQTLQLARLYKMVFARDAASGPIERTAGFVPTTELSSIDRRTLARSSTFLTSEQLDVLR